MGSFIFNATLKQPEGESAWMYVDVPADLTAAFGKLGQMKVKGTVNGEYFSSTALPRADGTHYLVIHHATRLKAGAFLGDTVHVVLESDREVRVITPPQDLATALDALPAAKLAFAALSFSDQKEFVEWIESAKKEATRKKRVLMALEMLLEKKTPKGS